MNIVEISILRKKIRVDIEGDFYGEQYWRRIEKRNYEPDTIAFIESNCDLETDFMVIGAANGAMSIIAGILGARVSAYEPDGAIHKVFLRNLELNSESLNSIKLHKKALSDLNTVIEFSPTADNSILSSIVFSSTRNSEEFVEVSSIIDEIDNFHYGKNRKLIIKMDIEGAEWRILSRDNVIKCLRRNRATILLAVHPGFTKPIPKLANHNPITRSPWLFIQFLQSLRLYSKLIEFARISRTNGNAVINKYKFALLIAAGYHEFIIAFERNEMP